MLWFGKFLNCLLRFGFICHTKPHWDSCKNGRLVDALVISVYRKRENLFLRRPKCLVQLLFLFPKFFRKCFCLRIFSSKLRKMCERSRGCNRCAALIELTFDRQHRPALDPAMANSEIFWETVFIVCRSKEFVRVRNVRPIRF